MGIRHHNSKPPSDKCVAKEKNMREKLLEEANSKPIVPMGTIPLFPSHTWGVT